jgi:hypothetical protein
MRRVLFFGLLGPFLVWLTFVLLHVPEAVSKPLPDDFGFVFAFLLAAYVVALLPSLVVAGLDEVMARSGAQPLVRIAACAGVGYAAAIVLCYLAAPAIAAQATFAKYWPALGLLGAVPGAVCSWLSGGKAAQLKP